MKKYVDRQKIVNFIENEFKELTSLNLKDLPPTLSTSLFCKEIDGKVYMLNKLISLINDGN